MRNFQGDILVVSCTGDRFIDKGIYRPHIPQKMRALNLAAFEMVDYVLIDENRKPLNLLKKLNLIFLQRVLNIPLKAYHKQQ